MSRFERGKDWNYSAAEPVKKPVSKPVSVSRKYSLWSAKYECTFFGATKKDCERQLMEMDAKRKGQRVLM